MRFTICQALSQNSIDPPAQNTPRNSISQGAISRPVYPPQAYLDGNTLACQRLAMAKKLTQLGRSVPIPASPAEAILEAVPNPQPGEHYLVRFTAPEFTTLCPVTGQPDFAHFVIDYVPGRSIVESKSLKLFLSSFRNHAAFHEDCTLTVGKRVVAAIKPHFLRIAGYWYPRGGIPIDVFWQVGKLPAGVWLPDPGVSPYRGRG
ncbi:MAG TPA: preQ(1) synthase [Rhizomicrobium sp.]|nr:preQ(1) synthase [Rhizomicrobium sp.]